MEKEGKKQEKEKQEEKTNAQKPTVQEKVNPDKAAITELTETLQRLQAEFENYRKRVDKEKDEFVKYAKADLICKILPILDTFEIAFRNTNDREKFVKGMEMVYAQLFSGLEAEGLRPIEALGKKFDPYMHEVMLKQKSCAEDGVVLEELQRGYTINGKVLRHSKVKISEKAKETADEQNHCNKCKS
jgi:molecular chaperone GrpE